MFCTNCGNRLPPGATACPSCGARVIVPAPMPAPPAINNYLVPAILVTLCCCVPCGIVAIVFAAQVNSKLAAGDIEGAMLSAKNAKMWTWIGFGAGALVGIIYVSFMGLAGIGGALGGHH
jgi:hypothetical protein